jgi:hypothetical protein
MIDGCFNEWVVHYFIYLIVLYIAALLCFVYITIATDQPNLDPHAPNRLGTFICVTPHHPLYFGIVSLMSYDYHILV